MKLISEYTENDVQCIVERKENGDKSFVIEGIFAQSESKNRNGRIYPKAIMERAVNKYVTEQVSKKRAVGELNHPDGPTVNLDKVSHLITDLRMEGNDVMGKAQILDTPMGKIVKGLLEGGVQLGVSTRGMGSLEQRNGVAYVRDDFILNTVDIVQDPSAPGAFVNGIMEGVEWVWNNGIIQPQVIEGVKKQLDGLTEKKIADVQTKLFKDFLNEFKRNI